MVAQLKEMLTTHAWVPHDLHFLTVCVSVTTACNIVNAQRTDSWSKSQKFAILSQYIYIARRVRMETVYDLAEGGFISMTTLPRILMSRATFPMLLQQLYYAWI